MLAGVADRAPGYRRRRAWVDRTRNPLPWLGALLAIYLVAPLAAFAVRLSHGASSAPGLGGALATSLLTATISTAIIALLGVPLAYVLARVRGAVGGLVTIAVALPLALPPLMSGILLLYLIGPYTALGRLFAGGLTDTRVGIVLAQTFVAAPFLVIAARAAFAAVDPELETVARTLGYGRAARFMKVALPVAWPGVQAGLLLAWLRAFGEFGATVIVAYHPYSLPVFTFVQFDSTGLGGTMVPIAAALAAALLVLVVAMLRVRPPRPRRVSLPEAVAPPPASAAPLRFSVSKRLEGFELELDHRGTSQRLALLGPSGAGKTLTLRLLAGIMTPDRAEVFVGERALQELEPERRGVGYVPQHSALMPGRTVWQQATFGVDADPGAAAWWLEQLRLVGLERRLPEELSGGQQRRVALARALARNPALLLLDEPFSALDTPVRAQLSRKLRAIQRHTGLSTVLVTHDPEEAALLADELIVIDQGRALQQGSVAEVLGRPASPQVAALLGIANTHAGAVVRPGLIRSGALELAVSTDNLAPGTEVTWAVRPEDIVLDHAGPHRARMVDIVALGPVSELTLEIEGVELTARAPAGLELVRNSQVQIALPAEAITVWPAGGTSRAN